MKGFLEQLWNVVIISVAVAVGIAVVVPFIQPSVDKVVPNLGGTGQEHDFNKIPELVRTTTSTQSFCNECPVKLLDLDNDRRYVQIYNDGSTNGLDVWLYATTTNLQYEIASEQSDTSTVATSTIDALNGIRVAPTTTYTILPENLLYGYIYASSTGATNIQINYYE